MLKIKEVIVVEGRHDSATLKKYFNVETIETSGSHMNKKLLTIIEDLNKKQGVILFLDPDHIGDKIRNYINQHIPNLKNAFISKDKAKTNKKVGVEHASYEDLLTSLNNLITYTEVKDGLSYADLLELGLVGSENSRQKRKLVADYFCLGDVNGKSILKRLNMLSIDKEEVAKIL